MNTIRNETRSIIKSNRKDILKVVFLYSILMTVSNLIAQRFNVSWVGIIISALISAVYLIHIFHYVKKVISDKHETPKWKMFFTVPELKIKMKPLIIGLSYGFWVLLAILIMTWLIPNAPFGIFAILFVLVAFVYANGVNVKIASLDKKTLGIKDYLTALKSVGSDYKVVLYGMLQVVKTVIQGALLIFVVNVFVFGPQIQELLNLPEGEGDPLIVDIFTNTTSSFIQGVGTQTIMFYLFFVTLVLFGTTVYPKPTME